MTISNQIRNDSLPISSRSYPIAGVTVIEILGTLSGIAGAIFNCQQAGKWRRIAYICWFPSNVLMLIWSASIGAWCVAGLYSVYTVTSSWGLWTCYREPS